MITDCARMLLVGFVLVFASSLLAGAATTGLAKGDDGEAVAEIRIRRTAEIQECRVDMDMVIDLAYRLSDYTRVLPAIEQHRNTLQQQIDAIGHRVDAGDISDREVQAFCQRVRKNLDTIPAELSSAQRARYLARFSSLSWQQGMQIRRSQAWVTNDFPDDTPDGPYQRFNDLANDSANESIDATSDDQLQEIARRYREGARTIVPTTAFNKLKARYPELFSEPSELRKANSRRRGER